MEAPNSFIALLLYDQVTHSMTAEAKKNPPVFDIMKTLKHGLLTH